MATKEIVKKRAKNPMPNFVTSRIARGVSGDTKNRFQLLSAYTFVNVGEESTVPRDRSVYICNFHCNQTLLKANLPKPALKIVYAVTTIMPYFGHGTAWWDAARTAAANHPTSPEHDYWHLGTDNEAGRIFHTDPPGDPMDSGIHHVKPTASLATRIFNELDPLLTDFWDGVFLDESNRDIPDHYWIDWKTANIARDIITDADRPYWNTQWRECVSTFITLWKNKFGRDRCVIMNGAGNEHPKADGTTIEGGHLAAPFNQPVSWAVNSFLLQAKYWSENPQRYGKLGVPLNIIWDYPLLMPGICMLGDNIG